MKEILWSKFNAVAKNCKVKNIVETLVKTRLGKAELQSYQADVESIYAFSRLTPLAEINQSKFIKADMQWQESIINADDEKMYKPLVEKYGKQNVILAVQYLIENGLWQSPKGNDALRNHQPNNYDGMSEIEPTIIYLDEQQQLTIPESAKGQPLVEMKVEEENEEVAATTEEEHKGIDFDLPKVGDAINKFDTMRQTFSLFKVVMQDFNAVIPDIDEMLTHDMDEITALKKRHEEDKKIVEKSLATVKENEKKVAEAIEKAEKSRIDYEAKARQANMKVNEQLKEIERIKGICTGLRNDIAKLERENADYKRVNETLKEASQKADLPKKKQIKREELLGVPLLGIGVLKGLTPVLEKHGIIIV